MAKPDFARALAATGAVLALLAAAALGVRAAGVSDVRGTKHNLSVSGAGPVKSTTESQVCVFCHTPHGATPGVTPLWNRRLGTTAYTPYASSSLDAQVLQGPLDEPGGSSKLCLSCHDGTVAIGNVNVLNGTGSATTQGTVSIPMTGTGTGGAMPAGSGTTTGFTRNLGSDLTNDHPISVSFTNALALRDGELRLVDANQQYPSGTGAILGVRGPGQKPQLPLEPTGPGGTGQIQCATCHDPHRRETDAAKGNQKFLRQNRFQEAPPAASHNPASDIICITCHDKNITGGSYAFSAHANPQVATQTYTAAASTQREFPAGLPVWRASCLNCHDTHTVPGARRLLREGTDSTASPKSGGAPALEENCYQCHTSAARAVISPLTTVPNIQDDFTLLSRRMPIRSIDQPAGAEMHDISSNFTDGGFIDCTGPTSGCGKDFLEPRSHLGAGNASNRHAECTDCHNPHRVVKFRSFAGSPPGTITGPPDAAGTHDRSAGATVTNIASGVLRGAWGVQPTYGSASFHALPSGYQVKRGDPGTSGDTSVGAAHLTREYQICLKCHSDYGFSDNNAYPVGTRPNLGYVGGTPSGTNNLTQYTNQAKEFQAPVTHRGETTTTDSGAAAAYSTNNHRSWHPVIDSTGRTGLIRGNNNDISARWLAPFSSAVGTQTIYCTDCHGSDTGSGTIQPAGGENGSPWGPHGSNNNFILKGQWNNATGSGQQTTGLCFKCHNYASYATDSGNRTGFYNDPNDKGRGDLHSYHANKLGTMRCNWCHVAVPHGWKNKAFLVNLNDVGAEAGLAAGTQVRNNVTAAYNSGPYYMNAVLKIRRFATSGLWREADCGSAGAPGNGQSGRDWMRDSSENCRNAP